MNICQKLLITWLKLIQKLPITHKTYSIFRPLPIITLKRKGHLIKHPTDEQINIVYKGILSGARIDQWSIIDNTYVFVNDNVQQQLYKRPLDIIDTIVIGASGNNGWSSYDYFTYNTSPYNDVTPDKALPTITSHIYISYDGAIEQTLPYEYMTYHTSGYNMRSINITIAYDPTNSNSKPPRKIVHSLIKVLAILCLQFKLNPLKAIKGQSECYRHFLGSRGHKKIAPYSPGELIMMDYIRHEVVVLLQKKLKYLNLYNGKIDGNVTADFLTSINKFNSNAIHLLYKKIQTKRLGE